MLDFTNIDALQFTRDSVNNIRVYYQNTDNTIRESCFDEKRRWYTTGNVVTTVAKTNSPIAVTSWNGGTEIRVYFLDANNKIRETVGRDDAGGVTRWQEGGNLRDASVAPGSQLGIARPGKDDSTLRVYYQEATTNKIREIMYWDDSDDNSWNVSEFEIPGALPGTRISAVSAKPPGDIRLYYQGTDSNLKEYFFTQQNRVWSPTKLPAYALTARAPICAVCWYADNTNPNPRDLRIRVFTITTSKINLVAQIVFNTNQGWNGNPTTLVGVYGPPDNLPSIAACQTTTKRAISLFYRPESNVIDLHPIGVSGNAAAEVKEVVIPRGIPIIL